MRLVVQRVTSSSVSIAGKGVVGSIGRGACVLIGIGTEDGDREIAWAAQTIVEAKLWDDNEGRPWKESIKMQNFGVLLVSQFTLYGKTPKKGKLDFHHAMPPTSAQAVYDSIVAKVRAEMGDNTQCGEFGANMEVSIVNDGPVTIIYDSKDYLKPLPPPKVKGQAKAAATPVAAPPAPPVPQAISETVDSATEAVEKISVQSSSSTA